MENKDPELRPSTTSQTFSEHLATRSQKVLQPTETIIKEQEALPKEPKTSPPIAAAPAVPEPPHSQVPLPTNIYPEVAEHENPNSTALTKENSDSMKDVKISDRESSLKLYAIVIMVFEMLSILWLLPTIATLVADHFIGVAYVVSTIIRILVTSVPIIIGAVLLLVSKNLSLVKAILIIILMIFGVSIASYVLILISFHKLDYSIATIGAIIPVILLFWTWNVFSKVNTLSE